MKCVTCGSRYTKADAAAQFDSHFGGLDYQMEITLGSHERDLCGDCAIEYMETKIRSQEGYIEPDEDFTDEADLPTPAHVPGECPWCQSSLSGGVFYAPYEDGSNEDAYVICPDCKQKILQ